MQAPRGDFDPSPRAGRCQRCGIGQEGELRFVILRGRTRHVGRTLEAMVSSEPDA
jgi:hypothetical protein